MAADWTQLPPELLETISRNLTIYVDYLRFRCVCQSWRSSTPKTPINLPPQLPWLMLSESHFHRPRRSFLNLSTNKVHSLYLPEASHGKRRCGSSHGWLVLLDETPSVLLLNPLTRAKVHLPPLSTFPNVVRFDYSEIGREYVLRSSSSGNLYTRSLRQMRDSFVKKVVLSSSPLEANGFTALAVLNQTGDLAFCKNGDQSWTIIDGARSYSEDVVYVDGLFYAVNKYGGVAVCDVGLGGQSSVSIIETPRQMGADMQYLVNSGDDLFLIPRYIDLDYDSMDDEANAVYRTVGFDVFKMDWRGSRRWEKISDLGDRMMFIGLNSSLSLSASDFPGCVGNCIYFTDDYSEFNFETVFGEHDSGIFSLWDKTIQGQWNSHCRVHWPPPLWVTPNPC